MSPVKALVDFTEERGLTCRVLSGFRFAVRNADNVFDAEREGVESGRSDEEVIARDLSGDSEVPVTLSWNVTRGGRRT